MKWVAPLLVALLASGALPDAAAAPAPPRRQLRGGGRDLRVLAYGDSLTAGFHHRGMSWHPYASELGRLLGGRVDYIGLTGWTTEEMLESADRDPTPCGAVTSKKCPGLVAKLGSGRYTHVAIMAGTNDLHNGGAAGIAARIRELHALVHKHAPSSLAMTLPEMGAERMWPEIRDTRLAVNEAVRAFARETEGVALVDVAAAVPQTGVPREQRRRDWDLDGLHMLPPGYDKVARAVYEVLVGSTR